MRASGWSLAVGAAATAAILAAPASAQPNQWAPGLTVRVVVPFPPGGASDILTRLLTQHISSTTGQSIVIENRPGAGTIVGTEQVARSTPDGTTLLIMANSFVINASLR